MVVNSTKKSNSKNYNSKSSVSSGFDKHKMWSIIGVVFALLVVVILVVYPYISGKKMAAAGQAVSNQAEGSIGNGLVGFDTISLTAEPLDTFEVKIKLNSVGKSGYFNSFNVVLSYDKDKLEAIDTSAIENSLSFLFGTDHKPSLNYTIPGQITFKDSFTGSDNSKIIEVKSLFPIFTAKFKVKAGVKENAMVSLTDVVITDKDGYVVVETKNVANIFTATIVEGIVDCVEKEDVNGVTDNEATTYINGKPVVGDKQIYVKGSVIFNKETYNDKCIGTPMDEVPVTWPGDTTSGVIKEYFCESGKLQSKTEQCLCINGACFSMNRVKYNKYVWNEQTQKSEEIVLKSREVLAPSCVDIDAGDNPGYPGYLTDNVQSYGFGSDKKECPKGEGLLEKGKCYCPNTNIELNLCMMMDGIVYEDTIYGSKSDCVSIGNSKVQVGKLIWKKKDNSNNDIAWTDESCASEGGMLLVNGNTDATLTDDKFKDGVFKNGDCIGLKDTKKGNVIPPNSLATNCKCKNGFIALKEGECAPKRFNDYCMTEDGLAEADMWGGEYYPLNILFSQGTYLLENYCKENKVGVEPYTVPNYPNPYSKATKVYNCDCYNGGCMCPQGTTTDPKNPYFPNCICPEGKMFDVNQNKCVAGVCPQGTSGTYPSCVCVKAGESFDVVTGKCFIPDTVFPYVADVTLPATVSFVRHELKPTYEIKVYNSPSTNFPKGVVSVLGYGFPNSPTFIEDFPHTQTVKWNDKDDYVVTLSDMKYQDYKDATSKSTIKVTVTVPCPEGTSGTFPACVCTDKTKFYDVVKGCITKCPEGAVGAAPDCVCTDGTKVYDKVNNACGTTMCDKGLLAKDTSYVATAGESKGQTITKTTCVCANGALDFLYGVPVGQTVSCANYCPVGSTFKEGQCVCEGGKVPSWSSGFLSSGTNERAVEDNDPSVDAWFCAPVSLPYELKSFELKKKLKYASTETYTIPRDVIFELNGVKYTFIFKSLDDKAENMLYHIKGGAVVFPNNGGWLKIGETTEIDLTTESMNSLLKYDVKVTITKNGDGSYNAKIEKSGASPPPEVKGVDLSNTPSCGNKICESYENCGTCSQDCNACVGTSLSDLQLKDTDQDGIMDDKDYCPNTPGKEGITFIDGYVMENGCLAGDKKGSSSNTPDGCITDVDIGTLNDIISTYTVCTPIVYGQKQTTVDCLSAKDTNDCDADGVANDKDMCSGTLGSEELTFKDSYVLANGCLVGDVKNVNSDKIPDGCITDTDIGVFNDILDTDKNCKSLN